MTKILPDAKLAIMCLDQKDNRFVQACIDTKTHYIDLTPSYTTLAKIESLSDRAADCGVSLMLGVGLSPGMSNNGLRPKNC